MDIHAQLVNGESLGTTEEEVDAVWETVLDYSLQSPPAQPIRNLGGTRK